MGKRIRSDGFVEYSGIYWSFALPGVITLLYVPVVACALWISGRRIEVGGSALVMGPVAGLLLWTAFEYSFHRWLLHHLGKGALRRIFWDALHREHHAYRRMHDPDHHGVHPALSAPIILTFFAATVLLGGGPWGPAVFAGWLLGYLLYEVLHWLFHSVEPGSTLARLPAVRALLLAHTVHHLQAASSNFGFVTTLWDHLLGTYAPPRSRARPATMPGREPGWATRSRP